MSSKVAGILSKVHQDRQKGDYAKALKRLEEAIDKLADDITLYKEAIEVATEAGESMRAVQFFKSAQVRLPEAREDLWAFGREKVESFNDPMLCKLLLDMAIKKRDFDAATDVLEGLKEHTAAELLTRIRTKRQVLSSAREDNFHTQLVINALAEALLCVRARAYDDAGTILVQVLDDEPHEHEALTAYLTTLHKKFPDRGALCYAAGWSAILSKQYEKAIALLSQGGSLDPAYAKPCLRRLETLKGNTDIPHPNYEFAYAKLLIVKGDDEEAAELLHQLLEQQQSSVPLILDLLDPNIQKVRGIPVLHLLYIEAALVAGKSAPAIYQIENVYTDGEHKAKLFDWLDSHAKETYMSADVLTRQGELYLKEKKYGKAIEAFRAVLSRAPHEQHHIKGILATYQENPDVKTFYATLVEQPTAGETAHGAGGGGLGIEHYGGNEFTLERRAEQKPRRSQTVGDRRKQTPAAPKDRRKTGETGRSAGTGFERERTLDLSGSQNRGPSQPTADARTNDTDTTAERAGDATLVDDGFEFSSGFHKGQALDLGLHENKNSFRGEFVGDDSTEDSSGPVSEEPGTVEPTEIESNAFESVPSEPMKTAEPIERDIPYEVDDSAGENERVAEMQRDDARVDDTPPLEMATGAPDVEHEVSAPIDVRDETETAEGDSAAEHDEAETTQRPRHETPARNATTTHRRVIELGIDTSTEPESVEDEDVATPPIESTVAPTDTPAETTTSTDTSADTPSHTTASAADDATASPVAEVTDDFDSQYQAFKRGGLDNDQTLALIERSARLGRMSEMRELLAFQPATPIEESQQKRYLAEFFIHDDQPAAALDVLKTVNIAPLDKQERKEHLLKIAYCQKLLNQYDAAQRTYLAIMNEDPDFCVAEQLARVSYEQHVQSSTSGGPVLEKVSSLHDAGANEEEN